MLCSEGLYCHSAWTLRQKQDTCLDSFLIVSNHHLREKENMAKCMKTNSKTSTEIKMIFFVYFDMWTKKLKKYLRDLCFTLRCEMKLFLNRDFVLIVHMMLAQCLPSNNYMFMHRYDTFARYFDCETQNHYFVVNVSISFNWTNPSRSQLLLCVNSAQTGRSETEW